MKAPAVHGPNPRPQSPDPGAAAPRHGGDADPAAIPVNPAPPGVAAAAAAAPDAAVSAEWRTIEAERIAEERDEASENVAAPVRDDSPARRWPWLAVLGPLAAGVLVASAVNFFASRHAFPPERPAITRDATDPGPPRRAGEGSPATETNGEPAPDDDSLPAALEE
jgi:hypothetical protein